MYRIVTIIFLFTNSIFYCQNPTKIEGVTQNIIDGAMVQLFQYNYGEKEIANTIVESNKFNFSNTLTEGVYSIFITNKESYNKERIYRFDLIVDYSEKKIKFIIDSKKQDFIEIVDSKINENYYSFINIERFRIAVIDEIESLMNQKNRPPLIPTADYKDILNKETKELREIRLKYIKANFNKWSTALVRNSTNSVYYENMNKHNYWSFYTTKNSDLINTPIYQDLIQYYISSYYKNVNEDQYIEAFQNVIDVFSKDNITKEWVVKYIITGLYRLKNHKLIQYFSKKYGYKI